MSSMSALFWRCGEAKWKPHVEHVLHWLTGVEKQRFGNLASLLTILQVVGEPQQIPGLSST